MKPVSLEIILKDDKRKYTTGDVITGTVVATITKRAEIEEIIVRFQGSSIAQNHRVMDFTESSTTKLLSMMMPPELFFQTPIKVHPSPELGFNRLILGEGTYRYDFSIPLPDDGSGIKLPPSFTHKKIDSLGIIQYDIKAIAYKTSGFIKTVNFSKNIDFCPFESTLEVDSSQLLDRSGLSLPKFETCNTSLKFGSFESINSNLFKKLVSHKSIKIPFELGVSFEHGNSFQTEKGITTRFIMSKVNLKSQISTYLGIPIAPEAIRSITFGNSADSKEEFRQDQAKINITHIYIMLQSFVRLKTELPSTESHKKWVLRDEKCDYQLNLNDFTSEEYRGNGDIYKKISPEIDHLANLASFHILDLPAQLFDCELPEDTIPTFSSEKIDYNYQLSVVLKTRVYPGGYSDKLGFTSNVIVRNNDSNPHPPDYKP
ncbi:hypothetical protein HYPBUDRAFT_146898 [Hyphopichia burtonii NRRL Y-1933]|uniref:Arrestin-like N-terminal domain-containing protein n=1 Tax=Hyphopichia burtonii NRRL Y-1933 TaxID=984485 RepID=A0A1E4RM37_9ASCO|nr:hypothetical protein HYPBUDRAFT_146898 [Hyphopichia burtonii NRRL Y-1933]ODV68306.1 hypothetical protein HYPBUDRAFT_146898 [Hyphopichia burtonii NRRL Y-1933]